MFVSVLNSNIQAREKQLSKDERSRNIFGTSTIFTHDPTITLFTYRSVLPAFPDITGCACKMEAWDLPTIGRHGFHHGLCPGVRFGLPGFPSLSAIKHTAAIGFHGVNIFNSESTNESMVITLENVYEEMSPEAVLRKVGPRVHCGYPFLAEAQVVCVSDDLFSYRLENVNGRVDVVKTAHTSDAIERFMKASESCEAFYSKKYGVIVGIVEVVVTVLPLKGMRLLDDGSLVKEFAGEECNLALSTLVASLSEMDPRFKERVARPIHIDFPVKSAVFLISTHPDNCGVYAEITGHGNQAVNIRCLKSSEPKLAMELAETREVVRKYENSEQFVPAYILAKQLGIPGLVLSRLTSNLTVICKLTKKSFNLGLGLKFEGKQLKVLGFTRKSDKGWEFSSSAKTLIQLYKVWLFTILTFQSTYPAFISGLIRHPNKDKYEDTDFYSAHEASDKLKEISQWLKDVGAKDHDNVSLETEALPKDLVQRIEDHVDAIYKLYASTKVKKIAVTNVPRQVLLKPEHAQFRLCDQNFTLGERVIHVSDSGSAPIGAKGTVIGIEGHYLEVLFDKPYLSGSNLSGRCSNQRGMHLRKDLVLNISRPQPPSSLVSRPLNEPPVHSIQNHNRTLGFRTQTSSQLKRQQTAKPFLLPPPNGSSWSRGPPAGNIGQSQNLDETKASMRQSGSNHSLNSEKNPPFNSSKEKVQVIRNGNSAQNPQIPVASTPQTKASQPISPRASRTAALNKSRALNEPSSSHSLPTQSESHYVPVNDGGNVDQITLDLKSMLNIGGAEGVLPTRHQYVPMVAVPQYMMQQGGPPQYIPYYQQQQPYYPHVQQQAPVMIPYPGFQAHSQQGYPQQYYHQQYPHTSSPPTDDNSSNYRGRGRGGAGIYRGRGRGGERISNCRDK